MTIGDVVPLFCKDCDEFLGWAETLTVSQCRNCHAILAHRRNRMLSSELKAPKQKIGAISK